MGKDKNKTQHTTGTHDSMRNEHPGKSDGQYRGAGSQGKGQGQYQGQGLNKDQADWQKDKGQGDDLSGSDQNKTSQGWNDRAQRPMQQGDETRPAQPDGTSPLDKDEQSVNKNRPVQQNR